MKYHNLQNIQTTLNSNNEIISISFDLVSRDDETLKDVEHSWIKNYDQPIGLADDFPYEKLYEICDLIAKENHMFEKAEEILLKKSLPVPVGDPNQALFSSLPVLTEEETRQKMIETIDFKVANIYSKHTRFQLEYLQREEAALKFREANYEGDPTQWVSRFAENNNITNKECADLIIAQARQFRDALFMLGNLRMDKYKISNAVTMADAINEYNNIINECEIIDGSLS